jgi:hypothetical protein
MKIIAYKDGKKSELHLDEYGYLVYKNGRRLGEESYSDASYSDIRFALIHEGWHDIQLKEEE